MTIILLLWWSLGRGNWVVQSSWQATNMRARLLSARVRKTIRFRRSAGSFPPAGLP